MTRHLYAPVPAGLCAAAWLKAFEQMRAAERALGPEDRVLAEAYTLYTYAVRERIDERARREAP